MLFKGRRRKVKDRDSFTDFHPNSLCGGGKRDCHRMTLALPLHSLLSMSGTRDTDPRFARDGSDHADPIPTANETNICDHCVCVWKRGGGGGGGGYNHDLNYNPTLHGAALPTGWHEITSNWRTHTQKKKKKNVKKEGGGGEWGGNYRADSILVT